MKLPLPANEVARLRALRQYNILDSAPEQEFDDLTCLATQICCTPAALISFVDAERVWFKSKIGLNLTETPRDDALCAHAILESELFIVADTLEGERFKTNAFAVSEPYTRFYAGMPLVSPEGYVLGTLCVVDRIPRSLSQEQKEGLRALARQVMSQLELRSSFADLTKVIDELSVEIVGRKRAQEANRQSEARLQCIVDSNMIGIIFDNLADGITRANDAFFKIVGYTRDDLLSGELCWSEITPQEHRHLDDQAREEMKTLGTCAPYEKEYLRRDGSRVPVLFGGVRVEGSQEEFVYFVLDLTEHKEARERVKFLAYHDALTDLPNQVLFKDRLQQALGLARRNEQILAVMLVNLDRFKTINDTLGSVIGDRLLREVAQRLVSCVRDSDTVARFGSDEFAILLTQINRTGDAAKIAQNIKDALDRPFNFSGQELFITISIGISLHPYDAQDTLNLLKGAGTALYRAKEQDGNNYQFYTAGKTTRALKQLLLENNLRPGLERGEFIVYYQPQVNIITFQLVGMEALVRWQHPGLGLLHPVEFITMAEDNGLIVLIGEYVMRAACRQSKSWQDAGFEPLRTAVNLSARQFQQPKLVDTVAKILKETGLDPHYLELELTESSVMKNPEQAIGKLHELKAMGVRISIDDFGTGYSSLNYLKRFPIDTLKVDQSFVSEISTDSDDAAIVSAIITLAHALKLNVIAEGVETQEQLEFLRLLECDEVQGFLFSKPVPAEEFTQLLKERWLLRSRPDYSTRRLPHLPGGSANPSVKALVEAAH